MAFYKNTKEMPDEVNALFNELELNNNLSFLAEIEKLQQTLMQNIENITDFMTNSINFITAKLEPEGADTQKINDIISRKVHLDHQKLNLNIINYKSSSPNPPCLQTTYVVPAYRMTISENNNTAYTISQPKKRQSLSFKNIKSAKTLDFDKDNVFQAHKTSEEKKDNEDMIVDKGFIIKKSNLSNSIGKATSMSMRTITTTPLLLTNFSNSLGKCTSTKTIPTPLVSPVLKERYSDVQGMLNNVKDRKVTPIKNTSNDKAPIFYKTRDDQSSKFTKSSQIFQKNYDQSKTLKIYEEYKRRNYNESGSRIPSRKATDEEKKTPEFDQNNQQSKEHRKDKINLKTYIQSQMNNALLVQNSPNLSQVISLEKLAEISIFKNSRVVKGSPNNTNKFGSNEGSKNHKRSESAKHVPVDTVFLFDSQNLASMRDSHRKGSVLGKIFIEKAKQPKRK